MKDIGDVRGRTEDSLLQYVATMTRNRLVDSIRFYEASRRDRRRHDARSNPLDKVQEHRGGPEEHAIHDEQIARFHHALTTFSERDRTLLRERIENQLPFDELATMLGFASGDSTRKAFHVAQARLLSRIRSPR
jgi:RNA polymerase sigma factor (sigma-70 family)